MFVMIIGLVLIFVDTFQIASNIFQSMISFLRIFLVDFQRYIYRK